MITLSKDNMRISPEFEVMDGGIFNAYIETWFDVDEKFEVNTKDRDDVWLNLYADYDTKTGSLTLICALDSPNDYTDFIYEPTDEERATVIEMMREMCQKECGCSMEEYVKQFQDESMDMG